MPFKSLEDRKAYWSRPEVKARRSANLKRWKENNPEKMQANNRRWYAKKKATTPVYWTDRYEQARTRKSYVRCTMHRAAKVRAYRDGTPFDLRPSDIEIPDHCPVLGIPLVVGRGRIGLDSPTLDRINPSLGYVVGNVMVISNRANRLKSNASVAELRAVLAYLESGCAVSLAAPRAVPPSAPVCRSRWRISC